MRLCAKLTYDKYVNGRKQTVGILLTTIAESVVNSTVTVTGHPVISGNYVSDHIYRDPDTISLSGKFSLNGSKNMPASTMTKTEELFDEIKNNGYICTLVRYDFDTGSSSFKERKNLILQSITWTEGINTLGFDFTFKEIIVVPVTDPDKAVIDDNVDEDFQYTLESTQLSFSETYIDWSLVGKAAVVLAEAYADPEVEAIRLASYLTEPIGPTLVNELVVGGGGAIVGGKIGGGWGALIGAALGMAISGWATLISKFEEVKKEQAADNAVRQTLDELSKITNANIDEAYPGLSTILDNIKKQLDNCCFAYRYVLSDCNVASYFTVNDVSYIIKVGKIDNNDVYVSIYDASLLIESKKLSDLPSDFPTKSQDCFCKIDNVYVSVIKTEQGVDVVCTAISPEAIIEVYTEIMRSLVDNTDYARDEKITQRIEEILAEG